MRVCFNFSKHRKRRTEFDMIWYENLVVWYPANFFNDKGTLGTIDSTFFNRKKYHFITWICIHTYFIYTKKGKQTVVAVKTMFKLFVSKIQNFIEKNMNPNEWISMKEFGFSLERVCKYVNSIKDGVFCRVSELIFLERLPKILSRKEARLNCLLVRE